MGPLVNEVLAQINAFLKCETPNAWIKVALENQDIMLIDHANCEKKAASTAMNLLYKYTDNEDLIKKMCQLAREELLHYEQVVGIMSKRGIEYAHLSPARYAASLRKHVRTYEPQHIVDILIIGALIEARSCERFAKIAPFLDDELQKFYHSLLRSEGRHYQDYLALAKDYSPEPIEERVEFLAQVERDLIETPDSEFRFHSGVPSQVA